MATPPKPPKDSKPAARRAPRKAPATSTARRAAATPPKQAEPVKAEAPKATAPKTAKASAAAKPPRAKSTPRAKTAAPKAAPGKSTFTTVASKVALPDTASVAAAAKVVTDTVARNRWTIGAIVAAAGAGLAAFLTRGRVATALGRSEGHAPTDLLATGGPSLAKEGEERAIPAFRPDMDAPMTAAERESLRPATGAAPTLVSDRGGLNSQ